MNIEAHTIDVQVGSDEALIFQEMDGGVPTRRVTIHLDRFGAEEVAQKLGEILKARRSYALSLSTDLAEAAK